MDEAAQRDLKVWFIKLVLLLDAFMILIAVAILLYVWMPTPAGRVTMVVFLAAAAGLFLYVTRMYRRTKQWLEEEHRKSTSEPRGDGGDAAGAGGGRTD
jgi:membrane protein implicated in regulation of membrane protease activity